MPYYFLSEETAEKVSEHIRLEIFSLENQILEKKEILENLKTPINKESEIPGHGRIMPQEMGKIPDALKDVAKQAMDEHNHIHIEEENETKHKEEETGKDTKAEKPIISLTKADLTVPKFPHDKKLEQSYKTLFYLEMPDGRTVLRYMGGILYTTKEKILTLPYPMPNGYLKETGLSANQCTGLRLYREHLFREATTATSVVVDSPIIVDQDEWKYKKMGLNDTHVGKEDFNKIEGDLQ